MNDVGYFVIDLGYLSEDYCPLVHSKKCLAMELFVMEVGADFK